ncbi:hypothetical protein [Aestuariivivens sediminicola]|uniref:hypothetical protein n=1 Tax=Aestuariivivens sediminicola TaxID=2913560 RepID=UPI001F55D6BB|nr:hypothetical protein [Aestuariivivens sediminicola]
MEHSKLVEYLLKIQNSDLSIDFAKNIEKEILSFGPIHPALNYQLAVIHINNGLHEIGYKKYKSIIRDEIESGFENYNTSLSDSAGMSAAYLLLNLYSQNKDDSGKYDLFLFAYMYLSNHIKIGGNIMCDSFKNRAYITDKFSNFLQGLGVKYLGSYSFIPIPCTIGDYYYAAVGYNEYGATASLNECIERAGYLHRYLDDIMINGKDANEYNLVEMAKLGRQRSDLLFSEIPDLDVINGDKLVELLK